MAAITDPAQIEALRRSTIIRGIRLEARGMKMSRGRSALSIARSEGWVKARTAKAALAELGVE